jgi:hypothetical protein
MAISFAFRSSIEDDRLVIRLTRFAGIRLYCSFLSYGVKSIMREDEWDISHIYVTRERGLRLVPQMIAIYCNTCQNSPKSIDIYLPTSDIKRWQVLMKSAVLPVTKYDTISMIHYYMYQRGVFKMTRFNLEEWMYRLPRKDVLDTRDVRGELKKVVILAVVVAAFIIIQIIR